MILAVEVEGAVKLPVLVPACTQRHDIVVGGANV